jgi:C1A family cysteine protease
MIISGEGDSMIRIRRITGLFLLWTLAFAGGEQDILNEKIKNKEAAWTAGENWVTELSPGERRGLLGEWQSFPKPDAPFIQLEATKNLPPALDWRNNGGNFVTPVRNQGSCGSCWAFSAVGQIESWKMILEDSTIALDLSEQFLLSCTAGSCQGWSHVSAIDYVVQYGIPSESCFSYTANDQTPCGNVCPDWQSEAVHIPGWGYITLADPNVEAIKQALTRHPVSASFTVYSDFYSYSGGVYEHVSGEEEGGHAIVIVGYNDAQQCWIVKNSWGPNWGENGYFRIKWGEAGIGEYIPFIYDSMTDGNLFFSQDTINVTMRPNSTQSVSLSLSNHTNGQAEFLLLDYLLTEKTWFHASDIRKFRNRGWWCADTTIGGYGNHWLQYLELQNIDLSGSSDPMLEFMLSYAIEEPVNGIDPYDGWDGANLWLSEDDGKTFQVIDPVFPEYTCRSLWAFGHSDQGWNMGPGIPGWAGKESRWQTAQFDLSDYAGKNISLRFAFASDMGFCTLSDASYFGFAVDEIVIFENEDTLYHHAADDLENIILKGQREYESIAWLTCNPKGGIIEAGDSVNINLQLNSAGLEEGNYELLLQLMQNDSSASEKFLTLLVEVSSGPSSIAHGKFEPETFQLVKAYPNPFNASVTFVIDESVLQSELVLRIFDLKGRQQWENTIHNKKFIWNGHSQSGFPLGSGIYLYQLSIGEKAVHSGKVVMLK